MPRLLVLAFALLFVVDGQALAEPESLRPDTTFHVFTREGDAAGLDDILAAIDTVEVVLIGEVHDDPVAQDAIHRLVRQLLDSGGREGQLALSMEMFERDVQPVVDEYLAGLITEDHFVRDSRAWPGYEQQYRRLVELAREENLPVIAANPPRRYVNLVAREGMAALHALPDPSAQWLPPLPYAGPSAEYRRQWLDVMRESAHPHGDDPESNGQVDAPAHHEPGASEMLLDAQALWDAGMAHAIGRNLQRTPASLVLHLSGAFHVEYGTGIAEHLARYRPGTRILTVTIRPEETPAEFAGENRGRADFVFQTGRE